MQRTTTAAIATILATLAAPAPLSAQSAPTTLLHLSATSSVQATPDELVADLVAQSTSASAAEAQRHVNTLIADGTRAAQGMSGINARAIGYMVTPADENRAKWSAQQMLELRGGDGPALLDLVNRLQQKGFATAALDWRLSSALRRATHEQATTAALQELQKQAASAAATLGLKIDHLQDVRLNGPAYQPRPPMPMQAMMARAAPPPPQATAEPEDVTAEVSAEVVLRP
jgi:uncharacterized protein